MSERDDFGSFLSGFVFGGLVGAVVALLMAPQSGEESRTYLREKGVEFADTTRAGAEEALRRAETAASDARARAEAATAEARVRADEVAQMLRARGEDLRNQGRVVLEEQRARIEGALDKVKPSKAKEAAPEAEAAVEEKPATEAKPKKKASKKKDS